MYKILIASDREVIRTQLKSVCEVYGLHICSEAETLEQALICSELYLPNIVIFNFRCALKSQTGVISQIAQLGRNVNVLVYSPLGPTRSTQAYIRAGASGFLCAPSNTAELMAVLRGMIAGFTLVPIKALSQPRIKLAHRPSRSYTKKPAALPVSHHTLGVPAKAPKGYAARTHRR